MPPHSPEALASSQNYQERYRRLRVLVTGGLGFIGSNLVHALVRAGAQVAAVDAQVSGCGWHPDNLAEVLGQVQFEVADIQDRERMRQLVAGREVIFNLAGEVSHINSMNDPQRDLAINCAAQVNFLDVCRTECPRATVVYASSRQVYGRPKYLPVDEAHPVNPVDYNGVHKYAAEHYHLLLRQQFNLRTLSLRLGNIYGPRQGIHQDCRGFIDTFVRIAIQGQPITIFGDGEQLRGMTYVDDAVDAFLRAGLAGPAAGAFYNVGHPQPVSLRRLAETLSRLAACPAPRMVPFPSDRKAIDIGDLFQNTERFRTEFGWMPRVGLEEGLSRTLEFFRPRAQQRLHAHPHTLS